MESKEAGKKRKAAAKTHEGKLRITLMLVAVLQLLMKACHSPRRILLIPKHLF